MSKQRLELVRNESWKNIVFKSCLTSFFQPKKVEFLKWSLTFQQQHQIARAVFIISVIHSHTDEIECKVYFNSQSN